MWRILGSQMLQPIQTSLSNIPALCLGILLHCILHTLQIMSEKHDDCCDAGATVASSHNGKHAVQSMPKAGDLLGNQEPSWRPQLHDLEEPSRQADPSRPASPLKQVPGHEMDAEDHLRESSAAAGHNERHPYKFKASAGLDGKHGRARKLIRDKGWLGICPGAVLERHHKVQTWMGVSTFLMLEPASYSRRILNDQVYLQSHFLLKLGSLMYIRVPVLLSSSCSCICLII